MTALNIQGTLFDLPEVSRAVPVLASQVEAPGTVYVAHFEQRTGPAMWKLGYTEASPFVRARQIACVPVTWWSGSMLDERKMHRQWKHHRVSKASEFFYHGEDIDRWVLRMTRETPVPYRDRQLATLAEILLRLRQPAGGYGGAAWTKEIPS